MKVQALIDQVLDEAMRLGQKPHGAYPETDPWVEVVRSLRNQEKLQRGRAGSAQKTG